MSSNKEDLSNKEDSSVYCQEDIHRFFLKSSVLIAAFCVTSVLTQLFNLAGYENKWTEVKNLATAEIAYYEENDTQRLTDKDSLQILIKEKSPKVLEQQKLVASNKKIASDEKLKLALAKAKLTSAESALNTNKSLIDLNESLTNTSLWLSIGFFFIGLFFWVMHLPYVQVKSKRTANVVSATAATDNLSEEIFSVESVEDLTVEIKQPIENS